MSDLFFANIRTDRFQTLTGQGDIVKPNYKFGTERPPLRDRAGSAGRRQNVHTEGVTGSIPVASTTFSI